MSGRAEVVTRPVPAAWRSPWTGWVVLGLGMAAAWAVLRAWTPSADPAHAVCALRRIAHIGCATCGLTRAFGALARGELGAAFALHPMALVLAGEIVAAWAAWGLALARGARGLETARVPWVVAANALAFLIVWTARLATGTVPL